MKKMIETLQNNYNSRLAKLFMINASFGFMCCWKIVETLINPVTKSKFQMYSSGKPKELLKWIHPSQLPKEYGGDFETPTKFWPPVFPPQTYRDEYVTMHMTEEQFREEVAKKPLVMPSPATAAVAKNTSKKQTGRVGHKIYYMQDGKIERRDSFNGIIEDNPSPAPSAEIKPADAPAVAPPPVPVPQISVLHDKAESTVPSAAPVPIPAPTIATSAEVKLEIQETTQAPIPAQIQQAAEPVGPKTSERSVTRMVTISKEPERCQNATELLFNSTNGSGKYEIQAHDFARVREAETTKYKKKQASKACCACSIV